MTHNQVSNLAPILPSLATLTTDTKHTARRGRRIRLYRPERTIQQLSLECREALVTLAKSGYEVRVYGLGSIFTVEFDVQGDAVWSAVKASRKVRRNLVVEVAL